MTDICFEQGPIRPPSEAHSLLLRLTRNCPWNRCEFCHTYKGERVSSRSVEEVKGDIDRVREIVSDIKALSWNQGFGGEITAPFIRFISQNPGSAPEGVSSILRWLYSGGRNVFLQDADSLFLKTDSVVDILGYLKESFPSVERITTYARAKTLSRKKPEELEALQRAGLSRIHIGLETGYDPLLDFVKKGVTAKEQIDAGRKVKEAKISLSEYVILGLGGKGMWRQHAAETAKVLNEIDPDFIRIRTLKVLKTMPLYERIEKGEFILLSDDETVIEEKLLVETLDGIRSTFVSDHILNLLEEVEGKFPEDKKRMLAVIDRYLGLPAEEKILFRLGRRAGACRRMDDLFDGELHLQLERALQRIEAETPQGVEKILAEMMESFI